VNLKRRAVVREIAFARRTMRGPTFGEGGDGQVDENQPEQGGAFVEPVQHAPATKPRTKMEHFVGMAAPVALTGALVGAVTGAVAGGKGRRARGAAIGAGTQAVLAVGLLGVAIAAYGTEWGR